MSNYTVKKIDEMEAVFGGGMKRARAELGVESFGLQVIDLPAGYENYPEHDHSHDGQEEVYVVLKGSGELEVDGERFPLDRETIARVAPEAKRKLWPGADGMRLVALGGVPGKAYEAPDVTKLGEPDPMAA